MLPKPKSGSTEVNSAEERNVRILMLAIDGEDAALWTKFRKAGTGRRVKVIGTLLHRITGHHHSRVIAEVKSMDPFKP